MAGVIEKIGEFFAQRDREQQQVVAFVASQGPAPPEVFASTSRNGVPGLSKDQGTVHHSPAVLRRRLSWTAPTKDTSQKQTARQSDASTIIQPSVPVPQLPKTTHPFRSPCSEDNHSDDGVDGLASWRSAASSTHSHSRFSRYETEKSVHEVSKGKVETPVKQRKKKIKKRKSSASAKSAEEKLADERLAQVLKNERIASGLARAQERARQILDEQQQQNRARRQAQREAVEKIKLQLDRIEQIRAGQSTPRSLASAYSVTSSSLSSSESFLSEDSNAYSTSSPTFKSDSATRPACEVLSERLQMANSKDSDQVTKVLSTAPNCKPASNQKVSQENDSRYLDALEQRTKEQMITQFQFRKRCLDTKKRQELLQQQLRRATQSNTTKQSQIDRLEQTKADIEKELARIVDELNDMRKRRHQLEEAGREDRLRRQKEAERALQRRLREEEWTKLMDEEKARSVVAAGAREKAGERVQQARKQLASKTGRHPGSSTINSGRRLSPGLEFIASLPPDLAEFEEEGLCVGNSLGHSGQLQFDNPSAPRSNQEEELGGTPTFEWQVPSFAANQVAFSTILFTEIVSDDDE